MFEVYCEKCRVEMTPDYGHKVTVEKRSPYFPIIVLIFYHLECWIEFAGEEYAPAKDLEITK